VIVRYIAESKLRNYYLQAMSRRKGWARCNESHSLNRQSLLKTKPSIYELAMEGTYCDACYCVTNIKHFPQLDYCVAHQNLSHLCFTIFIEMYYYTFRGCRQIYFVHQTRTCSAKQPQSVDKFYLLTAP
jgi:hypothetical protein